MVSDFRKKKLLHVFNAFFDIDKSGVVDRKDFELAVERISQMRGWKPGSVRYEETKKTMMTIWNGLQKQADKDNDGKVTADEWILMWDQYSKSAVAFDWQDLYCKFMFQLEDTSGDGEIDCDEYSLLYESFGLNKTESAEAFRKMAKGKSSVSWEEFQKLWVEYYTTEDQNAAGNFIYGCYKCC